MIFEKKNHHPGSIYTVDWSRSSRLIATGSNDKSIKVLSIQDGDVEALQGYNSSVKSFIKYIYIYILIIIIVIILIIIKLIGFDY